MAVHALAATASSIAKQVPLIDLPKLKNEVIDDEHDPDFDLAQYHSRIVEHSSGFREYIAPRNPHELPEPKRTQIMELLST
ncbi:hypothetical protein EG329_009728 [Mollisiaceae sp. DMI_Dod_QoI]|nr:hypothetical protein EG329_009728 [Helotiales sp. DMI_Dod_QoI]